MRFLLFSAQYLPTVGGVERYNLNLANTLQAQGHQVLVVTSALPNLPALETTADGVEIFRASSFLPINGRFPIVKPFACSKKNTPILYQHSYDFALINTRFYPLSLFAAKFCKRQNIPAIVLEHGTAYLSMGNALVDLFAHAYENIAIRYVKHYCKNFYGVSAACASWLKHFKIQAQGILYNAVNPAMLEQTAASSGVNYHTKYNLPEKTPIVAYSGRFIKEKGIFELLDAFSLLQKKLPDATLIMAGDGPYLNEIEQKKLPNVICTGMLAYADGLALLSQATVFCMPSYSEGFSTVILEVAALKTAIVTTATGGSPELIKDDSYGTLLQNTAPKTIADALIKAIKDDSWCTAATQNTYTQLQKNFTWQKTAAHFLEIAMAATAAQNRKI